ncbi:LacI family DNA-binding transcriptional regulator [Derxia gummosa]|uniref:LacI family DNA-binding transcriptional regulator n=1 Tax=Derxia gummosa DSM 723 TaxID=1121388 RepID=A0A8B6X4T8_9BURK|nr:LacI family DNA-binding transcriptional regulator [Derxia gummosa]
MPRKPRPRSANRVTLAEVAEAVGVSAITISRALNTPALVAEPLRERILDAVERMGYVPNRQARLLAEARSQTVLVLIPSLTNTVFIDVLAGIEAVLGPAGYQILIANTHYSAEEELRLLRSHLEYKPDGILVSGLAQSPDCRAWLDRHGLPTVHLMDLADDGRHCVGFSQLAAGRALTGHLIERGRRRIAFMAVQLDERTLKRADGWRAALGAAGLADESLYFADPAPSSMALGADLLDRILAARPDCDAVFCCNDDLAIGALARARRRGIAVPERLAIVGFNDLQPAAWTLPALTTVATPREQVGRAAARRLLDLIAGDVTGEAAVDLGFELRVRESG